MNPLKAPRRQRVTAFTLVELLSVIAIVGILAALVTLGVQSGIRRARASQCSSNIRQLGLAMASYMGEHKGHLYDIVTTPSFATWTEMLAPYVDSRVPSQNARPTGVWACSESEQLVIGASYSDYSSNYVAYGSPGDAAGFPTCRASQISSPASVIAFAESQGPASCTRSVAPWVSATAGIAGRHSGKANVVYFDLHVGQLDPSTLPPDSSLNRTKAPWH